MLQEDFNASGNAVYSLTSSYNAKGQLTVSSSSTTRSDGSVVTATTRNDYGSAQDYALGQVVSSTSETALDGVDGDAPDTANRYSFVWYDSAVQGSIEHDKSYSGSTAVGTLSAAFDDDYRTNLAYNAFGQLTSASVNDGLPHSVAFTLDEAGQVIRREETSPGNVTQAGAPHDVWYRFAGAEMGHSGNNGSDNVAAAIARDERIAVPPSTAGTFRGGGQAGTRYADFSGGLEALNSYYQGSRAGTYTVQGGESLQQVAAHIYGDANLWYKIAEANGLSGSSALVTGQTLRLPAGVVRSSHNAGTFKPYDPGQTIGELSPTTPKPKKGNNCGVVGAVLVAVVAVAVTVVTAGAALAAFAPAALTTAAGAATVGAGISTVLGGGLLGVAGLGGALAIGAGAAAVGSIVSQGVGVATGIQEKFSWKGVGLAAISGGITGGLGQNFGSGVGGAAIRGALSSAATQGIGTATGLQDSFSWVGVVAAGVGAAAGRFVGGRLARADGTMSFGASLAASTAGGIANAATRSAINGESFSRNLQAALPDVIGQVLGNAIAGGIAGGGGARDPARVSDWLTEDVPLQTPRVDVGVDPVVADSSTIGEIIVSANRERSSVSVVNSADFSGHFQLASANSQSAELRRPNGRSATLGNARDVRQFKAEWVDHLIDTDSPFDRSLFEMFREANARLAEFTVNNVTSADKAVEELIGEDILPLEEWQGAIEYIVGNLGPSDDPYFAIGHLLTVIEYGPGARPEFDWLDVFGRAQYAIEVEIYQESQQLLNTLKTAGERRASTLGVAYVGANIDLSSISSAASSVATAYWGLPEVHGKLLNDDGEGGIPGQIARRLEGRIFRQFSSGPPGSEATGLVRAFWLEVAREESIMREFTTIDNKLQVAQGNAPFANTPDKWRGVPGGDRIQLHHQDSLENNGRIFDMRNLLLVTPRRHNEIHEGNGKPWIGSK